MKKNFVWLIFLLFLVPFSLAVAPDFLLQTSDASNQPKSTFNVNDNIFVNVYVAPPSGSKDAEVNGPNVFVISSDKVSFFINFHQAVKVSNGEIYLSPLANQLSPTYVDRLTGKYYGWNFQGPFKSVLITSRKLLFSFGVKALQVGEVTLTLQGTTYLGEISYPLSSQSLKVTVINCPNTICDSTETASSCPTDCDSDGDGIPDNLDKCLNTPVGKAVYDSKYPTDYQGCMKGDMDHNTRICYDDHMSYLDYYLVYFGLALPINDPAKGLLAKVADMIFNGQMQYDDHMKYLDNYLTAYNHDKKCS